MPARLLPLVLLVAGCPDPLGDDSVQHYISTHAQDTGCDADRCRLYYVDLDGDGYGDPHTVQGADTPPPDTVEVGGDCDDTDASISPGVEEVCDAVDNNCDGQIDEGTDDEDGDGICDALEDPASEGAIVGEYDSIASGDWSDPNTWLAADSLNDEIFTTHPEYSPYGMPDTLNTTDNVIHQNFIQTRCAFFAEDFVECFFTECFC